MDDAISRKAALNASEKIIKDCNPDHFVGHQKFIKYMDDVEIGSFGNWQFANGFNMGLTAAEVAIEKLPSTSSEQQWIPCSKRLPIGQTEVIASMHDDSGDTAFDYTASGWVTPDGRYWIVDGEINNFVVAWMPLPKPWKGEQG